MQFAERIARALCDLDLPQIGGSDGNRLNPELPNWKLYLHPARVAIATMRQYQPVPHADEHTASVDCWCHPTEIEKYVWLHSDDVLRTDDDDHLEMPDYQPSPHAVTQGDDCQ